MNETHEVVRPFEGPGSRQFAKGELVDARAWRHVARLVAQRLLRPLYTEQAEMNGDDRLAVLEQALAAQDRIIALLSAKVDGLMKKGSK